MANLVFRDPFGMTPLSEAMNQLLNESFVTPSRRASQDMSRWLPLDAYETEQSYVVRLAVPGLQPEQFEVTVQQNTLTVRGKIESQQPENVRWLAREHLSGEFMRSVQFPSDVVTDQIEANLAHGILSITLPKTQQATVRRIQVNAANNN
jgi:HSP20 family protein